VPGLTQAPIEPGSDFVYEFALPDAGTYWYHPHERGQEQVARGLYGVLVVEEREPIRVDRELTWVLGDWKLDRDASLREDFDSLFDVAHGGRMGNTVTINGRFTLKDGRLEVRSGERIRLRLVNAAVARSFLLNFSGHDPRVIAYDGQPIEPHVPDKKLVALAPGMRADVVLDCMMPPGSSVAVTDEYNPGSQIPLMTVSYREGVLFREAPLDAPVALAPNPLSEPDLARAERLPVVFEGGAMGALREAKLDGEQIPLQTLAREHGLAWAINGVTAKGHLHEALFTLRRGGHYVMQLRNETRWPHPIHLHGHAFRVISRYGRPTLHREWRDTVHLEPREHAEIAFVADNPGDWMFHCHILAHQAGGMMAMVRVA
jgi:FtsP/CotA-like multicopper oxidase with cupredoxin domain